MIAFRLIFANIIAFLLMFVVFQTMAKHVVVELCTRCTVNRIRQLGPDLGYRYGFVQNDTILDPDPCLNIVSLF